MAKKAKVKPTYMTGSRPMTIGLHDVVRIIKALDKKKHSGKFQKAAQKKKMIVSVPPETVNFVKDYFADNNLHTSAIGKHIVKPQPAGAASLVATARTANDRYSCDFGND